MAITATLNGNITVTDGQTGTIAYTKTLAGLSTVGSLFTEAQQIFVGTGGTSISLPVSPTNFLYVKNLHISNTVAVTWTPNGGSGAAIITLQPGSAIIFVEANLLSGITAMTLTGSASNTNVEYLLAG